MTTTAKETTFKPFLVDNGRGTIFRVHSIDEASREQIETLLERLPLSFSLQKTFGTHERLRDPLEVYVSGCIILIYPPRHRIISNVALGPIAITEEFRKLFVDNLIDMEHPGNEQVRCCVHFPPQILGVEPWTWHEEIEVDTFVFPRDYEPKPEAPRVEVEKLLDLIAGEDTPLTVDQLGSWRELIMFAIEQMRRCYENPDTAEDYPMRVYYKPCWEQIEAAGKDPEKLVEAIQYLRASIEWR